VTTGYNLVLPRPELGNYPTEAVGDGVNKRGANTKPGESHSMRVGDVGEDLSTASPR
jgi:hypothetical protein